MNARTEGWSRLDDYIANAKNGEADLMDEFCTRVAIGERHSDIALSMGFPWFVLRQFLEDKPERGQAWDLAKRCFADELVYEGLKVSRDSTKSLENKKDSEITEADIALAEIRSKTAKLQFDAYTKTAGKVSREEWERSSRLRLRM